MSDQTIPPGALDGIRVIDLTRILSGPFCQLLADMGAEVIKIEPAKGDPVRNQGVIVEGMSWYFAQFNRNKKSVVLDLYTDEGKDIRQLLKDADVLVENFRPGVLAKMGFDEARLKAHNPRLIIASVNGYGSTGPGVDRPSFDFIAQAMSGFMSVNGAPDADPMRAAPPMSDLVAGLYCAFGVVCALQARTRTGVGQRVESALTNGLVGMLACISAEYLATGQEPTRTGNNHPIVAPYGLFRACDGRVAVAPHDVMVRRFLGVRTSLLEEERFRDNDARMRNCTRLTRSSTRSPSESVDHRIETINKAGCPCGRVMTLAEVFNDPQIVSQEMVIAYEQPGRGTVRVTGFPMKLPTRPAG